jgi:transcriptional regulator with XRE-family HTH domain
MSAPHELLMPDEIEKEAAQRGLSMRQVCEKAGIGLATWYRWKNEETSPTIKTYQRLRDAAFAKDIIS